MSNNIKELGRDSCIFVAGHRGMVGSAIVRGLKEHGCSNILTRTSVELDLTCQQKVQEFFSGNSIEYVFLAAAKVGGIYANNTYPAEFIYRNLMIQSNVIHAAYTARVKRLLFLGSSCIYPKFAPQPMSEGDLLTGILEPTNEPYAVAKIAGIKMCESYNRQYGTDYRSVMPTNLYGPGDNFHLENSHVIPAIMRKYHLAKLAAEKNIKAIEEDEQAFGPVPEDIRENLGLVGNTFVKQPVVTLWGTGTVMREFLHVDDMASACLHVMQLDKATYSDCLSDLSEREKEHSCSLPSFVNVGSGKDCTIREVAETIRGIVGFRGETRFNPGQPDGTPRKLLDTRRLNRLGWTPDYQLRQGLEQAYRWYCQRAGNY